MNEAKLLLAEVHMLEERVKDADWRAYLYGKAADDCGRSGKRVYGHMAAAAKRLAAELREEIDFKLSFASVKLDEAEGIR